MRRNVRALSGNIRLIFSPTRDKRQQVLPYRNSEGTRHFILSLVGCFLDHNVMKAVRLCRWALASFIGPTPLQTGCTLMPLA